ncbi:hypothetical protein M2149_000823 [Lachnospiraceae bacterium PFB1-21]
MILKKILQELVLIRKELQAIRSSKESLTVVPMALDGKEIAEIISSHH